MSCKSNKIIIGSLLGLVGIAISCRLFRNYCSNITFKLIDEGYENLEKGDKKKKEELKIYPDSFSKSFSVAKKKKIFLIISGFRDTPKMWNDFEEILKENNIDYIIPRMYGFGRTFYQYETEWKDWVISVMDCLSVIQNFYEEVNILGYSTGAIIAMYISQFKWKCQINNVILCCPNLMGSKTVEKYKMLYKLPILNSLILTFYPVCFRPYTTNLSFKDCKFFFEYYVPSNSAFQMWKFQDEELPDELYLNNIVIVKANNDKIVEDGEIQRNMLEKTYNAKIDLKIIPSKESDRGKMKVSHNMFTINNYILNDIYGQIKEYL